MVNEMKKNTGFSIAEVILTLSLIGIIAILVLPPMINNNNNRNNVILLKKAYVEFNQVLDKLTADRRCSNDLACSGLFATGATATTIGQALVPYFNVVKDCGVTPSQGCMPSIVKSGYDGSGSTSDWDNDGRYKFITSDGIAYSITNIAANCASVNYSTGKTGNLDQTCGMLRVDVNGPKKGPNFMGRDLFIIYISNGKGAILYPRGGMDDNTYKWWNDPSSPSCQTGYVTGANCAGRVIEDGWQMNY